MKVLIITPGRYPVPAVKGGAVSNLVEHLIDGNSKDKQVDMYITSPYDVSAVEKAKEYKNCNFYFIKMPKILNFIENFIYKLFKLIFRNKNLISIKAICSFFWFILKNAMYLKKNEFDCVIIENTARLFWCIRLFGNRKKYKGKVYYHLHNEPKKFSGCEKVIRECNEIICVSEYIKNVVMSDKNKLNISDSNQLKVLYNCIDTSEFCCSSQTEIAEFKKKMNITDSDRIILFSGRIDDEKGVLQVLESLDFIKTKNVKLLIIGSSFYGMNVKTSFEEKIINIANKNKNKVIFTGFLKYSDMPLAYSSCEIAVLPSMWEEPAGLTIIEAMSCGKPVITTYSGGIPEYATPDSAILLERTKSISKEIAKNIDLLLSNKSQSEKIGKNARERVVSNFDSNSYMKKIIEVMNENNC